MSEKQTLWVEEMCRLLAPIERETWAKLGEEKGGFFDQVAEDWLKIFAALLETERAYNLVLHRFLSLFKEIRWLRHLFGAGNYPLLLSRLRFVWEFVFRAYLAEHYSLGAHRSGNAPWPSPDDELIRLVRLAYERRRRPRAPSPPAGSSTDKKAAWLDKYERHFDWDRCLEPVLRVVFPLADREKEVRDHYKDLFQELHKYVHPSASLEGKMIDDSALFILDNFDEAWAQETVGVAAEVFDLVWLAVFGHHPEAFERVEKLSGDYRILKGVFEGEHE